MAPLQLRGLRGKHSTPSILLGGTGAVSTVGEWEQHGAGVKRRVRTSFEAGVKEKVRSFILLRIMH